MMPEKALHDILNILNAKYCNCINSTIYIYYNLQIPYIANPNTIIIESVNSHFNVHYIVNPDPRFLIPSTTYFGELDKFSSINGSL